MKNKGPEAKELIMDKAVDMHADNPSLSLKGE